LLNEYGIKGIVYDGRQDGKSYVVFDDKAIKILRDAEEAMADNGEQITDNGRVKYSLSDDPEAPARARRILDMAPLRVTPGPALNQKEAENAARSFGDMRNENDGRTVRMPITTIGKLLRHKGVDTSRIVGSIPELYKTSLLAWSDSEDIYADENSKHRTHNNVAQYHHYINKYTDGDGEYFIRFTVNEMRAKPGTQGGNLIHSTAISDVEIYRNGDYSQSVRVIDPVLRNSPPFVDKRLQQFFDLVKRENLRSDEKFSLGDEADNDYQIADNGRQPPAAEPPPPSRKGALTRELKRDNARLRKMVEKRRGQVWRRSAADAHAESISEYSKGLVKGTTAKATELSGMLERLYNFISSDGTESEPLTFGGVKRRAEDAARYVVTNASELRDEEGARVFHDLRAYLRGRKRGRRRSGAVRL
jgi:hypothetical protein